MKKLVLLLFLFSSLAAFAQWKQCNNGMYGGQVKAIASLKENIYIGTPSGIYKSTDNGDSWVANGLQNIYIYSIVTKGDSIFVGTAKGLYISIDNGVTWVEKSKSVPNLNILSIAVNGNDIFIGTNGDGVFLSTDNGESWEPKSTFLGDNIVQSILVSDSSIFVGTREDGIFHSSDYGNSWTVKNNGIAYNAGIITFVKQGKFIYAGSDDYGLYFSYNNGDTWSNKTSGIGDIAVNSILLIGDSTYIATSKGIFLSTDICRRWVEKKTGIKEISVNFLFKKDSNIFMGTSDRGILISGDNFRTWTPKNTGIGGKGIKALTSSGNYIFAGGFSEIFRSSDEGESWELKSKGLITNNVTLLASNDSTVFAGTWGGLYKSKNNGETWIKQDDGLPSDYKLCSLLVAGENIYAGLQPLMYSEGVYYSSDNGINWNSWGVGFKDSWGQVIALIDNQLIVGGARYLTFGYTPKVFQSYGKNDTWAVLPLSLSSDLYIEALAVNGANVFLGTTQGVYRSTDKGGSWSLQNIGMEHSDIRSFAISGENIFAGAMDGGVYLSTDNGETWTEKNIGLTNTVVASLLIRGKNVYAGTWQGGLFKAKLSDFGISGVEGKPEIDQTGISIYPNPAVGTITIKYADMDLQNTNDIQIIDILGNIVKTGKFNSYDTKAQLNIQDLSVGVYYLRIGAQRKAFVKE